MTATGVNFTPSDSLNEAIASWIESKVGVVETSHNSGPEIDDWLRLVGLPPNNEWCAATVHAAGYFGSRQVGLINPVPRTAGALKIHSLADAVCRVDGPARGRVFVVDHGGGKGHTGICTSVATDGAPLCGSGNTNAEGSRLGDRVAFHVGDPTVVHHGVGPTMWLDFGLAPQPTLVA
jgi:hypothetical protein